MNRGRKTGAILGVIAMIAGLGLSAPAMAAPVSLAGPYILQLSGDTGFYVGSDDLNAGTPVITVNAGRERFMHFDSQTTYFAEAAGLWTFSNGNFMAAANSCNGVTIKSSSSSNGTVWAIHVNSDGSRLFINRYCDQQKGSHDNIAMGETLAQLGQFQVFGPAGCNCWRRFSITSV